MTADDRRHMAHALALGRRGLGRVWPNPAVGCVIVSEGRVIGRGRTSDGGRPHAETQALSMAGDAARGATAYVTLEPCSHYGQTPPCAEALIAAGVSRVVVGAGDPDPKVNGRGIAMLRDAGIDVTTGVLEAEACRVNSGFLSRVTRGRPHLTLKLAFSLDGRIATASGESRWITGPEARRMVHALRASHDAVMVGGGTARADDPELTVRDMGADLQPVRIVASRNLNLPWPSRLASTIGHAPVWLVHGDTATSSEEVTRWAEAGARLLPAKVKGGHLDPVNLLKTLADQGLTRVFCEGGGTFAASLLSAGCVDELVVFTAGLAIGAEGQPGVGVMGLSALADAERFQLTETRCIGPDVMTRWLSRSSSF
ncbi:bifunctional diaminohydroxyphosphoribosylaminopyrimidine deaminase/5-amino-6-(5-phosphoribosylamino)uracil reductase RibD [Silicimonas sp. MF1-12-2]|uniref:bifunctional diaminohydroxyphosphoribosylaminopyrimidine deaminase/5-amino-6-(5-phosphoribosylamino)uracil reductase RibD n=1 Tax=Silicimonas sp. MF1-12-2 TaxID=3384793 RepID=UPI0039B37A6D